MSQLQVTLNRISQIERRLGLDTSPNQKTERGDDFERIFGKAQAEGHVNNLDMPSALREIPAEIQGMIQKTSAEAGVDSSLIKAVVHAESGFNPKALSHAGAMGLMQLMPGTAKNLGVQDAWNPMENLSGGTRYLKGLMGRYGQSLPKALAAYNAGPTAVDQHGGIPPYQETQHYVDKVMSLYRQYQKAPGGVEQ